MSRGPLFQDCHAQFSGHETFPLRYGWLKKAFDRVAETETEVANRMACWGDDAIARFGVGKNMVASMRHWSKATRIIVEPDTNSVRTTELGRLLFGPSGLDPWMEHPATLWLIHWQLAGRTEKTTWFWVFSHYPAIEFEREKLEQLLARFGQDRGWPVIAAKTLKNDIACFIRTYVARQLPRTAGHDDALESPLTELSLIKAVGKTGGFRLVRGPKTTLGDGVFIYALIDFWSRYAPTSATLSFEAIAHEPGGPGRVFLFDEDDVADRLAALDDATSGVLRWSETAGLKQVIRNIDFTIEDSMSWIRGDYGDAARMEAA